MLYDLIIIGVGPAGLSASIYASRYHIKHLVFGSQLGGAMSLASAVENYPGFKRISGMKLAQKMADQVKELGGKIKLVEVRGIKKTAEGFSVLTGDKEREEKNEAKTIILATGMERRKLGVLGEEEYQGRGVSYCATCDATFFREKTVAVIGGANAAVMSALHLSEFAKNVYLIYRGKALRAEPMWSERAEKHPKIEILYETNVKKILGNDDKVTGVELDKSYKGSKHLTVDGVFIEIGGVPGTQLVKPLGVELDEGEFVKVAPDMSTNVAGFFAAGDIANVYGEFQQIVIACAEGAMAALSVFKYLKKE